MKTEKHIQGVEDWGDFSLSLLAMVPDQRIFLLRGTLGAGKTTFVKEMVKKLGSTDTVQSPTFSIINEYAIPGGKVYHMDLYRLSSLEEIFDLGFEEYITSGSYCFIEWPEMAIPLLYDSWVDISIQVHGESGRDVVISLNNL